MIIYLAILDKSLRKFKHTEPTFREKAWITVPRSRRNISTLFYSPSTIVGKMARYVHRIYVVIIFLFILIY